MCEMLTFKYFVVGHMLQIYLQYLLKNKKIKNQHPNIVTLNSYK